MLQPFPYSLRLFPLERPLGSQYTHSLASYMGYAKQCVGITEWLNEGQTWRRA
jgi:hypothetical protein